MTGSRKQVVDKLIAKYGLSRNGHAIFAPSSSAMWLTCAGSLLINATAVDTAGIDAAQGTVAHALAEYWNRNGEEKTVSRFLGKTKTAKAGGVEYSFVIDRDMLDEVEKYVDWIAELPGDHYFEQLVSPDVAPIPGQTGTADHFVCSPGRLVITDLKYGMIRVYAERNTQAMLYALGAFLEWDWLYGFQTIVIRICQPRLNSFDVWECSREELLEFQAFARERADLAWNENAPRTPSRKACQWCAAKNACPARLAQAEALADDFDQFCIDAEVTSYTDDDLLDIIGQEQPLKAPTHDPRVLTTAQMSYALTFRPHFEAFFKGMAAELLDRAEKGETLPYQKLSDGRRQYRWNDPTRTIQVIAANYRIAPSKLAPPKILSIDKMKKLLRAETGDKPAVIKKLLKPLYTGFAGKRSLTSIKDERVDSQSVADEIADLVDEDEDEDL